MFDIKDITQNIDLGQITDLAKKAGLDSSQISQLTDHATDAVKYRVSKEKARGNENSVASLFSENENSEDDNKMASKMENDFVFNLTKKMGLPDNIANQLKGDVMKSVMSGVTKKLSASGMNNLDGIMSNLGDNDMVDKFKKLF